MSGWAVLGILFYTAVMLTVVFVAWAVIRQLIRIQAAILKHRASAGSWDDDAELYRAAGLEPTLPGVRPELDSRFLRGEGRRG